LRLRDYLSVPYVLEAETVEVAPGSWIRRVAYPELPRPPLQYSDPAWVARQAGLPDEIIALIDRDEVATAREPETND
jgi:hypothetical protein